MNKKAIYTSPLTTLTVVEMEGQICGASADIKNLEDKTIGQINEQGVDSGFMTGGSFENDWNQSSSTL